MMFSNSHTDATSPGTNAIPLDTAIQLISHVAQHRNKLLHTNIHLFPDYIKIAKYKPNHRVDTNAIDTQIAELQHHIEQLTGESTDTIPCDSTDTLINQLNNELINLHSTLHQFNTVYTDKLQPFVQQHLNVPPPTTHELQIDTLVPTVTEHRTNMLNVIDNIKAIKQAVTDINDNKHITALQQLKPIQSHTEQIQQFNQQYNILQQSIKRITNDTQQSVNQLKVQHTATQPTGEHKRVPSRRYHFSDTPGSRTNGESV